jgi:3-hydroxymyristoyl/3-hydroxydecanoyl-(acyl carrier protein) dehydratase
MPNRSIPIEDTRDWSDAVDVLSVLPHRYPFLFVDRLRVVEPGRRALGLKRVTGSEWFGEPELPNGEMPGLLVVEALAQTSGAVLIGLLDGIDGAIGYFAGADRVKFRTLPRVGDTLIMSVELVWYRRGVARLRGVATVDGQLCTRATFTTVVRGRAA